jgi:hypothetical protein
MLFHQTRTRNKAVSLCQQAFIVYKGLDMVEKSTRQQQQLLFARQQTAYTWKNVQAIQRGMVIVIMQEDVRVLGVKPDDDDCLFLSYTDPLTNTKTEQLFNHTDYVYTKL